jgi:hypothetical protein
VREIRTLGSVGAKLNGQATRPTPRPLPICVTDAVQTIRGMLMVGDGLQTVPTRDPTYLTPCATGNIGNKPDRIHG